MTGLLTTKSGRSPLAGNGFTAAWVQRAMLSSVRSSLLVLPLALALAACGIRGSGVVATETRELDEFRAIEFGGALDLIVHVGAAEQKVVITGDDNIVPEVETRVRGGELVIETEGWLRPERPLVVEIWVASLDSIDASGATNIDVDGLVGESFELELSGAAEADLRGRLTRLELEVSGAADIDARTLEAETVIIDLSGAGEAKVWASKSLDVDISGAGEVEYWGSPEVSQDIGGAGSIRKHPG